MSNSQVSHLFEETGLRLVVIISDGVRGHVNQSAGVASWLSKRTGAEVLELEIPRLKGLRRFRVRRGAAKLADGGRETALEWLAMAEGESTMKTLDHWFIERYGHECGTREKRGSSMIFISAGSMPALYNLALGRVWRCPCVTIMTPSVTGATPFDFAIIPEHDYPRRAPNVMSTVGAPNLIVKDELRLAGKFLLREYPPKRGRRWGVLIGGDDKNYRVTASWINEVVGEIFRTAERVDADLYVTTSRRTQPEAEEALKLMASGRENVRFMLIASSDPLNPVPAMLGICDEIFVTEDSVNMVSETVTAGHRAVLLRTERSWGLQRALQTVASMIASSGFLPLRALWGAPRFDLTFESFRKMGFLIDFRDWVRERRCGDVAPICGLNDESERGGGFNEARRAADWILSRLPGPISTYS